jgi:putative hemolysin
LEAIVGAIPSIDEANEPDAIQRDDGSWLIDGLLRVEELWEILGIEDEIEATPYGFQTVSGFVMSELDGIPVSGQHFTWRDLRFEVVDMDGRRVDKVLVSSVEEPEEAAESEEGDGVTDNTATSDE